MYDNYLSLFPITKYWPKYSVFNIVNLQKQCWKRMYCVCNVLHWFCFKVCRLCLVYIRYKLPCPPRRNNKLRKVYASYLWFSGAHHVETCSPCFPIFRCVPAKERKWLEKKTKSRYEIVFDAMLVYLTKQRTNTMKLNVGWRISCKIKSLIFASFLTVA